MPWHDQFSWKKIRDYGRLWKNRGCSPVESKPQEERERERERERVVGREELRRINIFSQALSNCPAGISLLI